VPPTIKSRFLAATPFGMTKLNTVGKVAETDVTTLGGENLGRGSRSAGESYKFLVIPTEGRNLLVGVPPTIKSRFFTAPPLGITNGGEPVFQACLSREPLSFQQLSSIQSRKLPLNPGFSPFVGLQMRYSLAYR
jgi:hypothetical protein